MGPEITQADKVNATVIKMLRNLGKREGLSFGFVKFSEGERKLS
jgi:hypothetical protein